MDTTQTITHVGLCAGYGGIELGLKRVIPNLRSVALCEIEAFACANLVAKMEAGLMDPAPIWTDLKTFPWAEFRDRVDILTGGYPCQPFSAAGKRLGKDDPRHLWPWIADGIRLMRPKICFFENVEGHISLGLRDVVEELASIGYQTTWGIFSASEVGAPHQRKRVFILANLHGSGLEGYIPELFVSQGWYDTNESACSGGGPRGTQCVAYTNSAGGREDREPSEQRTIGFEQSPSDSGRVQAGEVCKRQAWPSRPGQEQYGWEPPRVVANSVCGRGEEPEYLDTDLLAEPSGGYSEGMGDSSGRQDNGRESRDLGGEAGQWRCGYHAADGTSEGMGDSEGRDGQWSAQRQAGHTAQPNQGSVIRKAQPSLGGDIDGTSSGLDNAELYKSCDNRTDELRLLGNGVVPATAEKAFRVLLKKLNETPKDSGVAD